MHRTILIHNKNTPLNLQEKFDNGNIIEFDYSNSQYKSIDEYISKVVIEKIKSRKIDLIYIKDNLSSSYLELYGLRVAYHVRLTTELKSLPIVILSDLDGCSLSKLEPILSRIIFTKNIFLEPNSVGTIEKYRDKVFSGFSEQNYKSNFLDLIQIDSPENSTNHSIANEWAIYQWSKILGIPIESINKKIVQMADMLYFKYLKNKHNLQDKTKHDGIKKSNLKGKILLIDDKWAEGWQEVMETFISKHYDNVICDTLQWTAKDIMTNDLKSLISDKIKFSNPDLILLDLRLLYNEENTVSKISGIQILKYLREECKESINQGIQIIIFSASGDSLIVEEARKYSTLGYIKKDSPINKYQASKGSFNKLDQLIKDGIKRRYLKEIWYIQNTILQLDIFQIKLTDKEKKLLELKNTVSTIFETLNSNIPKPFIYSMFAIYKCIEIICGYYIYENYDRNTGVRNAYWIKDNKLIDNNGNTSTNNKVKSILNLLEIKNDTLNDQIDQISCTRNFEIHSGEIKPKCENNIVRDINEVHIERWLKMLQTILIRIPN